MRWSMVHLLVCSHQSSLSIPPVGTFESQPNHLATQEISYAVAHHLMHFCISLCCASLFVTHQVHFFAFRNALPTSMHCTATATYASPSGEPRVVSTVIALPLHLACRFVSRLLLLEIEFVSSLPLTNSSYFTSFYFICLYYIAFCLFAVLFTNMFAIRTPQALCAEQKCITQVHAKHYTASLSVGRSFRRLPAGVAGTGSRCGRIRAKRQRAGSRFGLLAERVSIADCCCSSEEARICCRRGAGVV